MLSNKELNKLREAIDHLDLELLNLLARRISLCDQVGEHKIATQSVTRDPEREDALLKNKIELAKEIGLSPIFVKELFELIINHSVKKQYQMKMNQPFKSPRVAYLGDQGSYSHQALIKYFDNQTSNPKPFPFKTFKDIVHSVKNSDMDLGVLPIENTTSGAILEVYDLLQGSGINIVGEEIFEIKHCLVGKNSNTNQIKKILGHPQAITQCNDLIQANSDVEIEYCASSADALEKIIQLDKDDIAAIANEYAATIYNLSIIKENISNQRSNFTRFIFICKKEFVFPEEIPCKVSIVFATQQGPGSLATVLNDFKSCGINLTKLQSRPIPEKPWEEMFYADFEGHLDAIEVKEALKLAENSCQFLKVLGNYPKCEIKLA
ncbi:prephenate dehydratase [Pleionea sediminis]|uniref:prephenate dehydratase n=1 Tax=Pleionea sediminis TaxID=2569479 RepID=UPI00118480FE|nr:prephenate dehydratase [Pleionea sediminis]